MAKYKKYITIGERDAKGKRKRKYFYGDTKDELERNIRKYFNEIEKISNPSDISFEDYAKQWKDAYKANKENATRQMYDNALDKCDLINRKQLNAITKTNCQNVINQYWDSPRTAQILKMTLKQIFNSAIEDGIIISNPASNVELPKYKAKEKRILTDAEIEAIKKIKLSDMDRFFVTVMMTFGLRPAEALALTMKDFDLTEKVLHITKALAIGQPSVIKTTKTTECRDIPIPDAFIPVLKAYNRQNKTIYLFHGQSKGLMTKSAYRRMSDRIINAIDAGITGDSKLTMESGITMYSFRHHRATQLYYLCQQGVISTKKAAYYMGHSEEVFLRIYSHIDESKEHVEALYSELII